MITINLLPEELKVKPKVERAGFKFTFKDIYFIYLLPVLICILLFIHLVLALISAVKGVQLTVLSKNWNTLQPRKNELDSFKNLSAKKKGK